MALKVPFSPPRIDDKTIEAVTKVLRSGWITTGPETSRFEGMITEYCGCSQTVCVNSASAGLELALRWFGVGEGDEVIVPAYTYAASANVVIHCGATPVFVDSRGDFNIDPEAVRKAITPRTKVVMPVDIGGWPCDYDRINEIVREYNFKASNPTQEKLGRILILADAAHSLGAVYKGRKSGTLGDISVFSFHAVKNLTTAEGGAICLKLPGVFDEEEIAARLRIKALHGQSKDALSKMNSPSWRYDVVEAGYKCNMTDIQAAMGIVELGRYEASQLPRRREIIQAYDRAFGDDARFECPIWNNGNTHSSYHLYMIRLRNGDEALRNRMIDLIFEEGVAVNVHFVPLPLMSFYQSLGNNMDGLTVAYDNYRREISLPVYFDLTDEMQDMVIDAVKKAADEVLPK